MVRRPPLACPQCAVERSRESSYAARICEACGIEFRPRGRVPIRVGSSASPQRFDGWMTTMAIAGVAALIGVRIAMNSPTSSLPPSFEPIVQPTFVFPSFDPVELGSGLRALEPANVDVVTHRLERRDGRVEATGLLAVSGTSVARPQVHVGFLGAEGVELGAVLGDVACSRLDTLPCPWGFAGSEPPGTTEVRIRASGQLDIGDLQPVARVRLGFDDEFDMTRVESNLPELDETTGRLIPQRGKQRGELDVQVSLPEGVALRSANVTLVGYAEASRVELVLPMPSPVGLTRRIELPEHERAIVRWQLWIDGPLR